LLRIFQIYSVHSKTFYLHKYLYFLMMCIDIEFTNQTEAADSPNYQQTSPFFPASPIQTAQSPRSPGRKRILRTQFQQEIFQKLIGTLLRKIYFIASKRMQAFVADVVAFYQNKKSALAQKKLRDSQQRASSRAKEKIFQFLQEKQRQLIEEQDGNPFRIQRELKNDLLFNKFGKRLSAMPPTDRRGSDGGDNSTLESLPHGSLLTASLTSRLEGTDRKDQVRTASVSVGNNRKNTGDGSSSSSRKPRLPAIFNGNKKGSNGSLPYPNSRVNSTNYRVGSQSASLDGGESAGHFFEPSGGGNNQAISSFRSEVSHVLNMFEDEIHSLKSELESQKLNFFYSRHGPIYTPYDEEKDGDEKLAPRARSGATPTSTNNNNDKGNGNGLHDTSKPSSARDPLTAPSEQQTSRQLRGELEAMQKKFLDLEKLLNEQQHRSANPEKLMETIARQIHENTAQILATSSQSTRQELLRQVQEEFARKEKEMAFLRDKLGALERRKAEELLERQQQAEALQSMSWKGSSLKAAGPGQPHAPQQQAEQSEQYKQLEDKLRAEYRDIQQQQAELRLQLSQLRSEKRDGPDGHGSLRGRANSGETLESDGREGPKHSSRRVQQQQSLSSLAAEGGATSGQAGKGRGFTFSSVDFGGGELWMEGEAVSTAARKAPMPPASSKRGGGPSSRSRRLREVDEDEQSQTAESVADAASNAQNKAGEAEEDPFVEETRRPMKPPPRSQLVAPSMFGLSQKPGAGMRALSQAISMKFPTIDAFLRAHPPQPLGVKPASQSNLAAPQEPAGGQSSVGFLYRLLFGSSAASKTAADQPVPAVGAAAPAGLVKPASRPGSRHGGPSLPSSPSSNNLEAGEDEADLFDLGESQDEAEERERKAEQERREAEERAAKERQLLRDNSLRIARFLRGVRARGEAARDSSLLVFRLNQLERLLAQPALAQREGAVPRAVALANEIVAYLTGADQETAARMPPASLSPELRRRFHEFPLRALDRLEAEMVRGEKVGVLYTATAEELLALLVLVDGLAFSFLPLLLARPPPPAPPAPAPAPGKGKTASPSKISVNVAEADWTAWLLLVKRGLNFLKIVYKLALGRLFEDFALVKQLANFLLKLLQAAAASPLVDGLPANPPAPLPAQPAADQGGRLDLPAVLREQVIARLGTEEVDLLNTRGLTLLMKLLEKLYELRDGLDSAPPSSSPQLAGVVRESERVFQSLYFLGFLDGQIGRFFPLIDAQLTRLGDGRLEPEEQETASQVSAADRLQFLAKQRHLFLKVFQFLLGRASLGQRLALYGPLQVREKFLGHLLTLHGHPKHRNILQKVCQVLVGLNVAVPLPAPVAPSAGPWNCEAMQSACLTGVFPNVLIRLLVLLFQDHAHREEESLAAESRDLAELAEDDRGPLPSAMAGPRAASSSSVSLRPSTLLNYLKLLASLFLGHEANLGRLFQLGLFDAAASLLETLLAPHPRGHLFREEHVTLRQELRDGLLLLLLLGLDTSPLSPLAAQLAAGQRKVLTALQRLCVSPALVSLSWAGAGAGAVDKRRDLVLRLLERVFRRREFSPLVAGDVAVLLSFD
jgi:hypothetical protein